MDTTRGFGEGIDPSTLSTGEIIQRGWHPNSAGENLVMYGWRAAYHERKTKESGFMLRVYHKTAAAVNNYLYGCDMA